MFERVVPQIEIDNNGYLFPISVRRAQVMVKERANEAGLEKRVTPHIFRHSLATDLLNKGVDIRVVQEFLGHRRQNDYRWN